MPKLRKPRNFHCRSITLYLPTRIHRNTNQTMALCTVCKGIPTNFFGPLTPELSSPSDRSFHYYHHTPSALRDSAANANGCPMCKILECQLNDDCLPQECKDNEPLAMKRAITDPQQAFNLWIGPDNISHNFFYVFPPKYRRLSYCPAMLTLALLTKMIRASTSQGPHRQE